MKILIYFFCLIASFSLNSDTQNEYEIENYFIDYSCFEEFSPQVLGLYVIDGDVPIKILEDTYRMAEILNQYIHLLNGFEKRNPVYDKIDRLLNTDLFQKFSDKHYNHHTELRDIRLIITANKQNIYNLHYKLNEFITKKNDYYVRQNNFDAIAFCDDIKNAFLIPLYKLIQETENVGDYDKKTISSLTKAELKSVWNDFKKYNLPLIQKYFESKAEQLTSINHDNTFETKYNTLKGKKFRYYFLRLNMFGQNWYLELYDDYVSNLHDVSLIQL